MGRTYSYNRVVKAGCFVCHGDEAHWFGGSAQGTAAQHTDRTGHETWVDVGMTIRYRATGGRAEGETAPSPRPRGTQTNSPPAAAAVRGFVGLPPKAAR